jgi:SAM-dependent methyltransferase
MTKPSRMNAAQAWTLFWSEQGPSSRCLALSPEFCERLDAHWRGFASTLSPTAKVIDLGCGSGAVGRALRSTEPRLQVTGVDVARVAASREAGLELMSNVAMEALPFPDGAFAAAVSQFGYEYAAAPQLAADEIARVVAPGAPLSFLIHHDHGPIVATMRRHRRAIEGVCGPAVKDAFLSGNASALAERIAIVKRECSNDPLVDAAGRGLQNQISHNETARAQVWKAVIEALAPELIMLESLDLSTLGVRVIGDVVEPLAEAFDIRAPQPLRTAAGEPIAWVVEGVRRG